MTQQIDTRFRYRVGCPKLPASPWGMMYIPSPSVMDGHPFRVRQILSANNVKAREVIFGHRHREGKQLGGTPALTILSDATIPTDYIQEWSRTVQQLSQYFSNSGVDISIEIMDYQAYAGVYIKSISADNTELLDRWDQKQGEIADCFRKLRWFSVDLVSRGIRDSNMRPTMLVNASDTDDDAWTAALEKAQEIISDNGRIEVDVELLHNEVGILASSESELPELSELSAEEFDEKAYEEKLYDRKKSEAISREEYVSPRVVMAEDFGANLHVGASVGHSDDTSGTLGGFFTMKFPEYKEPIRFGVTNHHVLARNTRERIDRQDKAVATQSIEVASPSDLDRERFLYRLRESIMPLNERIRDAKRKYQALSDPTLRVDRQDWRNKRAELRSTRDKITALDTRAGALFATSGHRQRADPCYSDGEDLEVSRASIPSPAVPCQWNVDWALFTIDPHRKIIEYTKGDTVWYNYVARRKITERGSICQRTAYDVAMLGRTSGWSTGVINPAMSMLNPTIAFTEPGDREETPLLAHAIVNLDPLQPFARKGDSGSFVLHNNDRDGVDATVLGLVTGSSKVVAYMTAIDLVATDMEEDLGGEVIFPRDVGEVQAGTLFKRVVYYDDE
ncbi:hypothetical protein BU24DRAFT_168434 [Aaosphaeria arxii CBS 175.79]|uniref:Uncharacterized protein n=1 Tax=Aaosphaeria arxii CBS 175.79 TaxID=1450172 RepID=A0A6A5XZB8_9PLEO|nr:uncharacterized protein BU24DRAFT_168434 [Aaosphaeria arxii CBS 175.79]KAF2018319.1 hypothetical protein BU24DRAFT_168434 [Aaosphaeria arxii CBS 175.79]